jgi:hypothetical protein
MMTKVECSTVPMWIGERWCDATVASLSLGCVPRAVVANVYLVL